MICQHNTALFVMISDHSSFPLAILRAFLLTLARRASVSRCTREARTVDQNLGSFLHGRILIRRKWLNSCWGVAVYSVLAFTSEKASSTESVDREHGQKLISCSSSALCRYQYCMKQLPLAEHAANNLAQTPLTEIGKGLVLKLRSPKTCIRFRFEGLLHRDMLH